MEWICSTCGLVFEPTEWMVKKWQHICKSCISSYQKAYRQRRKQEGHPIQPGKRWSREKRQVWEREYRERPGVRERANAAAKRRAKDPAQQAKMASRRLARSAIEMGKLVRQPCEVCGVKPAHAHHDDYLKPLDVRWLCPLHHRRQHPGKELEEASK